ncbi:hypothetical protein MANES_01G179300v8 [Manihot esculenta]|uniref:Pentacotripeptide-repeat region of PRORP domain-containing protein n=1 Tax=Manihot esculenta TaxID=3983 RepID=A0A2C9WLW8_MANES|nr:hypothetical protein MANES_01G179300v8 [Manihot esculenta]
MLIHCLLFQKQYHRIFNTHKRLYSIISHVNCTPQSGLEASQNPPQQPISSTPVTDLFLVEKLLFNLKQGNVNSLLNYHICLNPLVVVEVLKRCRDNLQLAQRFIDRGVLRGKNIKHSSMSLSAMIHVLVRSRRSSDAQALILRMIRRSGASRVEIVESLISVSTTWQLDNLVFDLLIRTYVQARKLREGTDAFTILSSKGFLVSINACNGLIVGLVKVGWIDLAWEVYREIVRSGIEFSVYTQNIMVNALCKDHKIDDVKTFVFDMEQKGIFADIVTYNTLVNAYCPQGLPLEAEKIFGEMLHRDIFPDLMSFSSLIRVLSKNGHLDQALVYFRDMRKSGLLPDNVIYNVLIDGNCRNRMISEALMIWDEIIERGCVMDVVTYNTILNGLCKEKMLTYANALFDEMLERGVP